MTKPTPIRKPSGKPSEPVAANGAERLVAAARRLLAERGLAAFKVLDVAALAGVNVALINYHFGGRDGLLQEVVRRAGEEVAARRLRALEALREATPGVPPALEPVVRAWLRPMFDSVAEEPGDVVLALMTHLLFAAELDPRRKQAMIEAVLAVDERFLDALGLCRPDIPRRSMAWRLSCAVGSYCFVFGQREPVGWRRSSKAGASASAASPEEAYDELVAFVLGGLAAPPPARATPRRRARPKSRAA